MNSWPSGKYLLYMFSILQLICIICSLVSHFHSTIYLLFKQLYFNNLHIFLIVLVNNNNAGFIAYFMWEVTKETIEIWCVWNNHKVQQKHISSIQKVLYTSYLLHYLTCYITKLSSRYWFPPVRGVIVGTFLHCSQIHSENNISFRNENAFCNRTCSSDIYQQGPMLSSQTLAHWSVRSCDLQRF